MHAGSNPWVFGFEVHTAAFTSLARVTGQGNKKKPEGSASPGHHLNQSRRRSRLCDRVLHGRKRFGMANCNVERLQSTHACRAFGEVGVGVHKDLQRPVQTNQQV